MNNLVDQTTLDPAVIESIVTKGDLSALNQNQLVAYYNYRCRFVGLDPSAKPFDVLLLNGKKVLYANASATQQLSSVHGLSITLTNRERIEGIYIVSARVTGKDGRITENQGAVDIEGQRGEKLANSLMKATTKAIRRTVLAHCGLGMLDETEVETIPGAVTTPIHMPASAPVLQASEVLEGQLKVMIPAGEGSKVYNAHHNEASWQNSFFGLIGQISSSNKIGNQEKNAKLASLFLVNEPIYSEFVGPAKEQFLGQVAAKHCEEFLPKWETLVDNT